MTRIKTLHIIRRPNDPLALEAVQHEQAVHPVAVLFIQDGVLSTVRPLEETYASAEDTKARGVEPHCKLVGYSEICKMITEASRVVVW